MGRKHVTRESATARLHAVAKTGGGTYVTAAELRALVYGSPEVRCPHCGSREFTSGQALAAHKWRCPDGPGKPPTAIPAADRVALRRWLEAIAKKRWPVGVAPSEYDLRQIARVDPRTIARRLGVKTYLEAVRLLGLKPSSSTRTPGRMEVIRDLGKVAADTRPGYIPTLAAYKAEGLWAVGTVLKVLELDRWNDLAGTLELRVNKTWTQVPQRRGANE